MISIDSRYFYKIINQGFRVVDGDTIDCTIDLGFSVCVFHRFRMVGYDAPETHRPTKLNERAMGKQVTEFLTKECMQALARDSLYVKSLGNRDVYGRFSCELYTFVDNQPEMINSRVIHFMNEMELTKESLGLKPKLGTNSI